MELRSGACAAPPSMSIAKFYTPVCWGCSDFPGLQPRVKFNYTLLSKMADFVYRDFLSIKLSSQATVSIRTSSNPFQMVLATFLTKGLKVDSHYPDLWEAGKQSRSV